ETLKQLGKEKQFKRYNSQLSAVMLVTLGISGVAGGALSDIGWAWVYAGKILLSALTFAVVYVLTEPLDSAEGEGEGKEAYSFIKQLRLAYEFGRTNLSFASLCLYGAVLYSMSWSVAFYSQVVFQSVGLSNQRIGLVNGLETWLSAAVAAVAFIGERRLGQRGTIVVAGVGFIISLCLFSMSGDAKSAVACFFLMAVVISYLEPLMEAYLNELLPSPIRATMLSVFSMMISVGMMITFSVIGFLADRTNVSTALQEVLIVWVPVCLVCIGWAVKRTGKRSGSE
ncbi:MAG: transporter, partial [Paenibacillus sp.]|nr:transporter [Paenibacillus sp.]